MKKKTGLTLYLAKCRKGKRKNSPLKSVRPTKLIRYSTPGKHVTPKSKAKTIVMTPKSKTRRALYNTDEGETECRFEDDFMTVDPFEEDTVEIENRDEYVEELRNALPAIVNRLHSNGITDFLTNLFKYLAVDETAPLDNISFQLFRDYVEFMNKGDSREMRYREETKDFWATGKLLFGERFLRFMRGLKHVGQGGICYHPRAAQINFVVPAKSVLSNHKLLNFLVDQVSRPGVNTPMIELIAQNNETSHILTFDGKKIVPNSGYIDLLDFEDEPKVSTLDLRLQDHIAVVQSLTPFISEIESKQHSSADMLQVDNFSQSIYDVICTLGSELKEVRTIRTKNGVVLGKLTENIEKSETRDPKSESMIDHIKTKLYMVDDLLSTAISTVDSLGLSASALNGTSHLYATEKQIPLNECPAYASLPDPETVKDQLQLDRTTELAPEYVKQRSDEWFELRKEVKVTGSGLYRAIGLENLKSMKEYFDQSMSGISQAEPSEMQQRAMTHGTRNEPNAVATIVTKIAPILFPGYTFFEEGAYFTTSAEGQRLIEVSPDGSFRKGDQTVACEIKCPAGLSHFQTTLHYELPLRYTCQVLAEMDVMNTDVGLYVCWTDQSTTVFKLEHDPQLYSRITDTVKNIYYADVPKKPNKVSDDVKQLKLELNRYRHEKVKFIGEFPSVKSSTTSNENVQVKLNVSPPHVIAVGREPEPVPLSLDTLQRDCSRCIRFLKEVRNLRTPKASEVLAFTLADIDRLWDPELAHGMPIGYVLRGWSLSVSVMRDIANIFHQVCHDNGIHVPCETFDGQWAQLMTTNDEGEPLTVLQFQRQYYSDVCSKSKAMLIEELKDIGQEPDISREHGAFIVNLPSDKKLKPLKTSAKGWTKREEKVRQRKDTLENRDAANVLDTLDTEECNDIVDALLDDIDNEILDTTNEQTEESQNIDQRSETRGRDGSTFVTQPTLNISETTLTVEDYEKLYTVLKTCKRRTLWESKNTESISEYFASAETLCYFNVDEINEMLKYLNVKLRRINKQINKNQRKYEKVNALSKLYGDASTMNPPKRKVSHRSPKPLKKMCLCAIRKGTYPKSALTIAHATTFYPEKEKQWREKLPVSDYVVVEDGESFIPFYSPDFSKSRNQLEIKGIDGTHIRTCLRAKICRSRYVGELKREAWLKVAQSKNTPLTVAAMHVLPNGKVIEHQNEACARTMFCEEVEEEMLKNNDHAEANFCHKIRGWQEAEDMPGVPAKERVERCLSLRGMLLEGVSFDTFPPPGMYIKGIPKVTFEALVCNLEGHLYMYELCHGNTYCWRSYSSLVGESFFGEMVEMDPSGKGVYTAKGIGDHMGRISQLHAMRLNPERKFHMSTTSAHVYPACKTFLRQQDSLETDSGTTTLTTFIRTIKPRDHFFDSELRKSKAKKPLGVVSTLDSIPKGVQPLRVTANYKTDESRIKDSIRQGITL